jgi:hypothetical protein
VDEPAPEEMQRAFVESMNESFGPGWRTLSQEEIQNAAQQLIDETRGEIAHLEQDATFNREVTTFGEMLTKKIDERAAGQRPVPPEVWGPAFTETIEERYGGWTTLAVNVCAALGFEASGYEPKEDRVFE